MKAFLKYVRQSGQTAKINSNKSFKDNYLDNTSVYRSYYKEQYKTLTNYKIDDRRLFTEVFNTEVSQKRYNEALCFYRTSIGKFSANKNIDISAEESNMLLEKNLKNYNIAFKNTEKSILENNNSLIKKGIFLNKEKRDYKINQRWNILFFILVLWIYTNIPQMGVQSISNIYIY